MRFGRSRIERKRMMRFSQRILQLSLQSIDIAKVHPCTCAPFIQ